MNEAWPSPLKVEVKTSRDNCHKLEARDLEGVGSDGYVAVLLTDRLCRGPRWVFVRRPHLTPGSYSDQALDQLSHDVLPQLTEAVNRFWSDWILDEEGQKLLFEQHMMGLRQALDWLLKHHPLRTNQSKGALRETRVAGALGCFRRGLDQFQDIGGPQQEGFVHQRLLSHALEQAGYRLNANPIGVPDIAAIWVGEPSCRETGEVRERLQAWTPSGGPLQEVRDRLLDCSDSELDSLCKILTGAKA